MSRASFGKPLKGLSSLGDKLTASLGDSLLNSISSGAVSLSNVNITGGTIDGVVLGTNLSNIGQFTTIVSGDPSGQGYSVCFYGLIIGDSACWEPNTGTWNIQGNLLVDQISNLGNIRITGNTISSTNSGGNINISPNSTGFVNISSGIYQTTGSQNISFNSTTGSFDVNTYDINTNSTTNTNLSTTNGDITLQTGLNILSHNITFISTGTSAVTVTTSTSHNLSIGDIISISGTNSTPNIDGNFIVQSVPSTTTFTITPVTPVTVIGSTGTVIKQNNINLTATDNVKIPLDTNLTFGSDCQRIYGAGTDLYIESCNNIYLNPNGSINVLNNKYLSFANNNLYSDGIDFFLNTGSNNFYITSNDVNITGTLTVSGISTLPTANINALNTCSINCSGTMNVTTANNLNLNIGSKFSNNLVTNTPIIIVGGITPPTIFENVDYGIEYRYYDNSTLTSKIGWFGVDSADSTFKFIPNATNTNNNITGSLGPAKFSDVTTSNLTVTGTFTIPATVSTVLTTERLSLTGGGNGSPTANVNITFISVTTSGIATGTLPAGTIDGFPKYIMISFITTGGKYQLYAPSGRFMDAGSGTTDAKTLTFEYSGQSVFIIWDDTLSYYILVNGGACLS